MTTHKETKQQELLRRAHEYAEFYEATRNFNTLGFFTDLIEYLGRPTDTGPGK